MYAERPPSHSEQRLRSTLTRAPPPSTTRHRHSHASSAAAPPPRSSAEIDDELTRAAFLCRNAATVSSPIHPTRPYSRPVSPCPSHRSVADESDPSLTRMSSRRKSSSLRGEESCPLSRARLERVLRNGRVVEGRSRSREPSRRDSDSSPTGWPWSDSYSATATKRPKSSTSSESSQCPKDYLYQHASPPCPTHVRSRSKTDSVLPQQQHHPGSPRRTATCSPSMMAKSLPSARPPLPPRRNDSTGSATTIWTPPLTADASPVLNNSHQHQHDRACVDVDDMRLLTPPPTPPLRASPYMRPSKRRELDVGSVEQLVLNLPHAGTPTTANTFNARKASETCRRMEGYVSFAAVEGLGMPPNGVDDDENDRCGDDDARADDLKRGTNIIGTWARKLFVGIATNNPAVAHGNSNPTTTSVA